MRHSGPRKGLTVKSITDGRLRSLMHASAPHTITVHSSMKIKAIWLLLLTILQSGTLFIFLQVSYLSLRYYLRKIRSTLTIIMT